MLSHPGATIMTLLELMEEKVKTPQQSKFWATITTLAPDMRTSPEFLMSTTRVDRQFTEFACFVQNATPSALKLKIPYGALERAPRMTDATYRTLARANRLRFGTTPARPALLGRTVSDQYEVGRVAGVEIERSWTQCRCSTLV